MDSKVKELSKLYRKLCSVPSPTFARLLFQKGEGKQEIIPGCLISAWTVRDLDLNEKVTFIKQNSFFKSKEESTLYFSQPTFCTDSSQVKLRSLAPKEEILLAVIRQKMPTLASPSGSPHDYLEIWNGETKLKSFDLHSFESHGSVNVDGQFGCLEWNLDCTKLVYVAEAKTPKSCSFFSRSKPKEDTKPGIEFVYEDDWGEALVDKRHPILCVADIDAETITPLSNILPANTSAGQAVWGPDNTIVCVGWAEEPRRLGLTYCSNRRGQLFLINPSEKSCTPLAREEGQSVSSPLFTPDFKSLVYLQNKASGPHRQCSKLMKIDWETKQPSIVVNVINSPTDEDAFPGIYAEKLSSHCFYKDWIILASQWNSKIELVAVNLLSGKIIRLTNDDDIGSWGLLDIKEDYIVASASTLNMEPHLRVGLLKVKEEELTIQSWIPVGAKPVIVADMSWEVLTIQPGPDQVIYEAIHVKNVCSDDPKPLIVWPHGGPHSAFSCGYQLYATLFVTLGYDLLLVNYRGSLGYGQKSIDCLLGKVGSQDVGDVIESIKEVRKLKEYKHLILFGGSHGGFLSAHLAGQYPDMFNICIIRNPVVDIPSMYNKTDIPDWSMVECGMDYKFTTVPDPTQLAALWDKSPVHFIHKIKVPTLLLIGKKDRRVPSSQGLSFYSTLKAAGVPTKLLLYDDNHALSNVDVEADVFMNCIVWIKEHLPV